MVFVSRDAPAARMPLTLALRRSGGANVSTSGAFGCGIDRETFFAALITNFAVAAMVLAHRMSAGRTVIDFDVLHERGFRLTASGVLPLNGKPMGQKDVVERDDYRIQEYRDGLDAQRRTEAALCDARVLGAEERHRDQIDIAEGTQ